MKNALNSSKCNSQATNYANWKQKGLKRNTRTSSVVKTHAQRFLLDKKSPRFFFFITVVKYIYIKWPLVTMLLTSFEALSYDSIIPSPWISSLFFRRSSLHVFFILILNYFFYFNIINTNSSFSLFSLSSSLFFFFFFYTLIQIPLLLSVWFSNNIIALL